MSVAMVSSTERNPATAPPSIVTISVRLLNEGVEVYRPTDALLLPNGRYELKPTPDYDPALETWEFPPHSQVAAVARDFANGPALIAVAL